MNKCIISESSQKWATKWSIDFTNKWIYICITVLSVFCLERFEWDIVSLYMHLSTINSVLKETLLHIFVYFEKISNNFKHHVKSVLWIVNKQ